MGKSQFIHAILAASLVTIVSTGTGVALDRELGDATIASVNGDYVTALRLYRSLAERGNAEAQLNLGTMYHLGQGTPQNYAEAVKWYRLAAEQGYADAQYWLGLMYAYGEGVPRDYVQAHKWFNLAGSRLPASKKELRDRAANERDRVVARMTPTQIAEAQKLASEWKPK